MTLTQEKMLSRIQALREQLNNQIDENYQVLLNNRTLKMSRELDKLIYSYMKKYCKQ